MDEFKICTACNQACKSEEQARDCGSWLYLYVWATEETYGLVPAVCTGLNQSEFDDIVKEKQNERNNS